MQLVYNRNQLENSKWQDKKLLKQVRAEIRKRRKERKVANG